MKYFGKEYTRRKIEIDLQSVNADDPQLQKRLARIEQNYSKLDQVFDDLESRFEFDERLATQSDVEQDNTNTQRINKKKPR